MATDIENFVQSNEQRLLDELLEFLRIPSISTLPDHKARRRRAAAFTAEALNARALEHVEIIPTDGHPLMYADWLHAAGKPTVLLMGITMCSRPIRWNSGRRRRLSPLFATEICMHAARPTTRASFTCMSRRWRRCSSLHGKLPVNVKFLIEGEEEIGGAAIAKYVAGEHGEAEGGCRAGVGYRALCRRDSRRSASVCGAWCTRNWRRAARRAICIPACTAARRPTRSSG